jgi:hypothetical protein
MLDYKSLDAVLPQVGVTVEEFSESMQDVALILYENKIITNSGYHALSQEALRLRGARNGSVWEVIISPDEYFVDFNVVESQHKKSSIEFLRLKLFSKIKIDLSIVDKVPFSELNVVLEIYDWSNDEAIDRWHFDLANTSDDSFSQEGSLTHLQYGGRWSSVGREQDHPIKIPRWNHPPVDILLLCEMVVANFFTADWDNVKENPLWSKAMNISQKLCYTAYLRKMISHLQEDFTTVLHEMDASVWR